MKISKVFKLYIVMTATLLYNKTVQKNKEKTNMNMRKIEKLGIELSGFGLGCMRFPMTKDESGKDVVNESISTEIIRTAIDGGVNT